jgi:hypothetical protein
MCLRTAIIKFIPTIHNHPLIRGATVVNGGIDLHANQKIAETDARVQAVAQAPKAPTAEKKAQALPASVVIKAPISPISPSLEKVQKLVMPIRSNLHGRSSIDRNTIIVGCIAAFAAFAALSAKVGTLAASQLVASNVIAFLQPGVTIFGFALKTGMFITLKTVVPIVTGVLLPIALPVVSTIVVSGVSILVMLFVLNQIIKKVEDSVQKGLTTMKDAVTNLSETVLRQVPGYGMLTSIFGDSKKPAEETPAQKQQRVRNETEQANRDSGALAELEKMHEEAQTSGQKEAAEEAIAVLKGEKTPQWAVSTRSKGLADLLEPQDPRQHHPRIYTRETMKRAQAAKQANA